MGGKFKILFILLFFVVGSFRAVSQGLRINELMSSNNDVLYDEDGDTPDWIEIFNDSDEPVNLAGYYVSDNVSKLQKWQLPEVELPAKQPFIIYASGKDRRPDPVFWYTIIEKGDTWKYIIPEEEPADDWKLVGFDDQLWLDGETGIGYGDNDDKTVIAKNTLSVFMRKTVTINDIDAVKALWFHFDFDDAFVAYLNGTEIARFGIGKKGEPVAFDKFADLLHEADIVRGRDPESYEITKFIHLLNEGENTLAIQVHNFDRNSSDFSAIPFLTVGYSNSVELDEPVSVYIKLPKQEAHTNFKLSSSGETVCLSHQTAGIVDSVSYGVIPGGHSFGRDKTNPEKWGLFSNPTPGLPNESSVIKGVVESVVRFSIEEMFLTTTQNLLLMGAGSGEEIRFTTDGKEPTIASQVYSSAIEIDKNSIVRARIFKPDFVPGKITSRTYLFDNLPTLPVVSVITDPDNLWDTETGIYILGDDYSEEMPHWGANYWEDWEKPASIEMTETDGERLFALNCGIKIFGGWSRTFAQKSLAVFFRNQYGDAELNGVQLFESKPITNFKSLVLRNSGNDFGYSRMRDGMMTSLVRNLDMDIAAYRPTIFYLNGEYWGIINLREKINEDYIENNHDADADKVDILQSNAEVLEGSADDYKDLIDFIGNNDMTDSLVYLQVTNQIDISNFIDYQLSEIYFNNRDWPGNNIKFWRPQTEEGKWRWLLYDTDFGFGIWNAYDYKRNTVEFATEPNGQPWPNPPWSTFLFRKLLENKTFKERFINRFADVLNTTFLPGSVIHHIDSLQDAIENEIPANFDKWGVPSVDSWNGQIQRMITFASKRPAFTRQHIQKEFSLPANHKIKLSILPSVSGEIDLNSLTITRSGWEGVYFEGVPIQLKAIAYPGYKFRSWQVNGVEITEKSIALNIDEVTNIRVIFEDANDDGNSVVFNEINYNSPEGSSAGDWVEIYNWGKFDIDISGWIFKDSDDEHEFVVPENTTLKSNGYLVFCKNKEKFTALHTGVENYISAFGFGLSGTGDAVRLYDRFGNLVDEVFFGAETPWPAEPDGGGTTLELRHYYNDNANAESWRSSLVQAGTPGTENSVTTSTDWIADCSAEKELKVYPNPFTAETRIRIENSDDEAFSVYIYSMDGRVVCNEISVGNEFVWRGENNAGQKLQSGIYICKVQSGSEMFTSKIILSR